MEPNGPLVILIEPFYGGSHKVLIDTVQRYFNKQGITCSLITLPAKKWHWRARCGALQIYQNIPHITTEKYLFCSSVLNLTEILGLRSDLQKLRKIVYFHENQLIYPVQKIKARDVQYAYNQILTCLSADYVLFNSLFNKSTFLGNIQKVMKLLPDMKPKNLREEIEPKSLVTFFPVCFPKIMVTPKHSSILHIVWPHRWEYDKGPEDFFEVLLKLKKRNHKFRLSVLGGTFTNIPKIFQSIKEELNDEILHYGFLDNKDDYYRVLRSSHVVVSTSKHEFFGVSILEATYCGCLPLVPNALVYPEIYPTSCLYKDLNELQTLLEDLCNNPQKANDIRKHLEVDFNKFSEETVLPNIMDLFK